MNTDMPVQPAFLQDIFYVHFYNYVGYKLTQNVYVQGRLNEEELEKTRATLDEFIPLYKAGFDYLRSLSPDFVPPGVDFDNAPPLPNGHPPLPGGDYPPTAQHLAQHAETLNAVRLRYLQNGIKIDVDGFIGMWRRDFLRYIGGKLDPLFNREEGALPQAMPEDDEPGGAPQAGKRPRSGPRPLPKELFSVHSSAPVYDIGETIARGVFTMENGLFPTAQIIGKTQGRIEILPFWDHENNRPLTPQNVNLAASRGDSEFSLMQEEAVRIATSYNEEMATYFYAMDAYWLMNARDPDQYVEVQVADLLQYTGKKPVKSHGKYTGTFRPDQLQRAGMMVYGMGFSMVELEKAVIKGVGERTHYKRLWDVTDMYMMNTLDGENYIESITYRPNEFVRNASFGSRRETALLMSKVLNLDYAKMVTARRLGRYYTWLWRDRAFAGNVAAPIRCALLLERAGVEVEKGKERYARRSLENALDRLETEGIIAQWVLLDPHGTPADLNERISFNRWLEMKISVSPPDVILDHYASGINGPEHRAIGQGSGANSTAPALDAPRLTAERKRRGLTLAMMSEETGIELSTLSRIMAGKTKRPHLEHVKALQKWLAGAE